MKILAAILSLYVLVLSVAPAAVELLAFETKVHCCEDSCSASGSDEESREMADDLGCCQEGCNPFISCHCCHGFFAPELPEVKPVFSFKISKVPEIPEFQDLVFLHSVWHPPKAA